MLAFSNINKLSRATIDELVARDRPDLTAPGGQDVNSIGSSRIKKNIVTINGTKYYEIVSITDTKPDAVMEILVKGGGANGFWGACYGTLQNKIVTTGSITQLFDAARLMEGEHKAVGAVYSRTYREECRISRTHSFIITGITNRSIRLAVTLSDGVEFRPMGILVEDAMQGDGAVVRIRRPVDKVNGQEPRCMNFNRNILCLPCIWPHLIVLSVLCGILLVLSKIGSAIGCCAVSFREKILLRTIDSCERDPLIAIANQGANMQMALMNSGGMQASMMRGMNPAALNAMMQVQGGMNPAALNAVMQAQMGGANTQITGDDTLPMGVKADDEKPMDIPVAEATDLEKGGFE